MNAFFITYKLARRIVIAVVGGTVLIVGIIMIVTPGPAMVVIPIGLAILGLEFAWARHWLKKIRRRISDTGKALRGSRVEAYRSSRSDI